MDALTVAMFAPVARLMPMATKMPSMDAGGLERREPWSSMMTNIRNGKMPLLDCAQVLRGLISLASLTVMSPL